MFTLKQSSAFRVHVTYVIIENNKSVTFFLQSQMISEGGGTSGPMMSAAIAKVTNTRPPRIVTARTLIFLAMSAPASTANVVQMV